MEPSLGDLEARMVNILSDESTAVVFDTNAYHPPFLIRSPVVDFTEYRGGRILSGYNALDSIRKSDMSDEAKLDIVEYTKSINQEFINLLRRLFHEHDNFLMPAQVHEELRIWVDSREIENYEAWKQHLEEIGENNPELFFSSNEKIAFFSVVQQGTDIDCIDAQYDYLRSMREFLEEIPPERIMWQYPSQMMNTAIDYLENKVEPPSKGDIKIIGTSIVDAQQRDYGKITIVTFDPHIEENAEYLIDVMPDISIEVSVLSGYSLRTPYRADELKPITFEPLTN